MTTLNVDRVAEIFLACLFKEGEDTTNYVKAEGITTNVGFHPDRIKENEEEIRNMLDELPEEFKESGGGGYSFLNACDDKNGIQWTGMHQQMEELLLLGIGVGKAKILMPRQFWSALPGGMPYFLVKDDEERQA